MTTALIRELAVSALLLMLCVCITVRLLKDGSSLSAKRNALVVIIPAVIFLIIGLVVLPDGTISALQEAIEEISA